MGLYQCNRCGRDTFTVISDVHTGLEDYCFLCYELITELKKQPEMYRQVMQKIQKDRETVESLERKLDMIRGVH